MKRRSLSKKEIRDIIPLVSYPLEISPKQKVEIVWLADKYAVMHVEDSPLLFEFEGRWLPLLKLVMQSNPYKKITVDMGAVKFIAGGADIMRPGVVAIEDGISAGDVVSIVDQKFGKVIAIGIALFSSGEMRAAASGKVVKNAHAAGDRLWELLKHASSAPQKEHPSPEAPPSG
ncbi:MAG: DUF1947 domain-containing protein [Candidatus Bilamarchaeaceae archaeon]